MTSTRSDGSKRRHGRYLIAAGLAAVVASGWLPRRAAASPGLSHCDPVHAGQRPERASCSVYSALVPRLLRPRGARFNRFRIGVVCDAPCAVSGQTPFASPTVG